MDYSLSWYVLPAAFVLDLALGDPEGFPHPIRWMGKAVATLEPIFRSLPIGLTLSGSLFAIVLISGTWTLTALIIVTAKLIHPAFCDGLEIILIYYAISTRSLDDSASGVYCALKQNWLQEAKVKVALIVGRDVDNLKGDGIARAAVETVGESLVDGVVSPLFFAIIGGAPLAMAYKMINTLDSMVGYKNETYRLFGKAAARIDDGANFIPARLAIAVISMAAHMLAGRGWHAWKTARSEGANHSSPNAGYPEAAFAGALAVQLGGPDYYDGRMVEKPYIGVRFGHPRPHHIKKACDLMMLSALIWLAVVWTITIIL